MDPSVVSVPSSMTTGFPRLVLVAQAYGAGVGVGSRGAAARQILGNSDFLGSTRKFGQSQFLKTSPCFYYYFEEINIFDFNLKSA